MDTDDVDITDLVPVTLVWDASLGSPTELQSYAGQTVSVPPSAIPLPQRGSLFGVRGYSRQGAGGRWEWVLQGDVDPVDEFVNSLTGKGGWTSPSSRATVKTMIQWLFTHGVPRANIAAQFPALYQAIAAEVLAEQSAG